MREPWSERPYGACTWNTLVVSGRLRPARQAVQRPTPCSFIDGRDERAELAVAEVEPQPGDDADQDRHEEQAVAGVQVGRDRAAEVGEHEQAAEVARLRDEVQDVQRQLDDPERQRGPRGIGPGPLLEDRKSTRLN